MKNKQKKLPVLLWVTMMISSILLLPNNSSVHYVFQDDLPEHHESPANVVLQLKFNPHGKHVPGDSFLYQGFDTPWQILSAIHNEESNRRSYVPELSYAGAKGPMQFMPATWNAYCSDYDIMDLIDSIECADKYLQANYKISQSWEQSRWRYNHADWYVDSIIEQSINLGLNYDKIQKR